MNFSQVDVEDLDLIPTQDLIFNINQNVKKETYQEFKPQASAIPVNNRFDVSNILSLPDLKKTLKDRIPQNTQKSTAWSVATFKEWRTWRQFQKCTKDDPMWPIPSLEEGDAKKLDYWISR